MSAFGTSCMLPLIVLHLDYCVMHTCEALEVRSSGLGRCRYALGSDRESVYISAQCLHSWLLLSKKSPSSLSSKKTFYIVTSFKAFHHESPSLTQETLFHLHHSIYHNGQSQAYLARIPISSFPTPARINLRPIVRKPGDRPRSNNNPKPQRVLWSQRAVR